MGTKQITAIWGWEYYFLFCYDSPEESEAGEI